MIETLVVYADRLLDGEPICMDGAARGGAPGALIDLRHGVTHAVVDGPEDGYPVVFMPGATLPLSLWDGLFEWVAEAGYRVIRYDRYGLGFSDRPAVDYDHDLLDGQLVELLTALDVSRPVNFVALAFGGPIAAEFALRHPALAAGVCLIAPDGFAPPLRLTARLALLPYVGVPVMRTFGDRALKARVPAYSADSEIAERVMAMLAPELRYRGFKRSLRSALRNLPIDRGEGLYRRLDATGVPVQLIWGRDDVVTPMPPRSVIDDVFSNADIRLVESVGHLPHFERLAETSGLILEFVRKTR